MFSRKLDFLSTIAITSALLATSAGITGYTLTTTPNANGEYELDYSDPLLEYELSDIIDTLEPLGRPKVDTPFAKVNSINQAHAYRSITDFRYYVIGPGMTGFSDNLNILLNHFFWRPDDPNSINSYNFRAFTEAAYRDVYVEHTYALKGQNDYSFQGYLYPTSKVYNFTVDDSKNSVIVNEWNRQNRAELNDGTKPGMIIYSYKRGRYHSPRNLFNSRTRFLYSTLRGTITNASGGYGTIGLNPSTTFKTSESATHAKSVPLLYDSFSMHSTEVIYDTALDENFHTPHFMIIYKEYEEIPAAGRDSSSKSSYEKTGFNDYRAHRNTTKASIYDDYGNRIIFKQQGFAKHFSFGRAPRIFTVRSTIFYPGAGGTDLLDPESRNYNLEYYRVQTVLEPFFGTDDSPHISHLGASLSAQEEVTIQIDGYPPFLFFDTLKMANTPALNLNNRPEQNSDSTGVNWNSLWQYSQPLYHYSKRIVPIETTRFQWLRENSNLNWDERSITVYLTNDEESLEAKFSLLFNDADADQVNLFSIPAASEKNSLLRILFLDEVTLNIKDRDLGTNYHELYLYQQAGPSGTLVLTNNSKVTMSAATVSFIVGDLLIDSSSRIEISYGALLGHQNFDNPVFEASRVLAHDVGQDLQPSLTHVTELVRFSSGAFLQQVATKDGPYLAVVFNNLQVINPFFAGTDFLNSRVQMALNTEDLPSGFTYIREQAEPDSVGFYFYNPFTFNLDENQVIRGSLFRVLTAEEWQSLLDFQFTPLTSPLVVGLSSSYEPDAYFSYSLAYGEEIPEAWLADMKTKTSKFAYDTEKVTAPGEFIPLFKIVENGAFVTADFNWNFDLRKLNLTDLSDEKSYLGTAANLVEAFQFEAISDASSIALQLGLHHGKISTYVNKATYTISDYIFALGASLATFKPALSLDGRTSLQAQPGADLTGLVALIATEEDSFLDDFTPAIEHLIPVCLNVCAADYGNTRLVFTQPTTIFGGLRIKNNAESAQYNPTRLAIELGAEVGSGTSGPNQRMAILYGTLVFDHYLDYPPAGLANEDGFRVTLKQTEGSTADQPQELLWVIPKNTGGANSFLVNRRIQAGTATIQTGSVGSLVIENRVTLILGNQGVAKQYLGFTEVLINSGGKLVVKGMVPLDQDILTTPLATYVGTNTTLRNIKVVDHAILEVSGLELYAAEVAIEGSGQLVFNKNDELLGKDYGMLKIHSLKVEDQRFTSPLLDRLIKIGTELSPFLSAAMEDTWVTVIEAQQLYAASVLVTETHQFFIHVEKTDDGYLVAKKLSYDQNFNLHRFEIAKFLLTEEGYVIAKVETGTEQSAAVVYDYLPAGNPEVQFFAANDNPLAQSSWQVYTTEQPESQLADLTPFWSFDNVSPAEEATVRNKAHIISGNHVFYYGGLFAKDADIEIGAIDTVGSLQFRASKPDDPSTDLAYFVLSSDSPASNPETKQINGVETQIEPKTLLVDVGSNITLGPRTLVRTANFLNLEGYLSYELDSTQGVDQTGSFVVASNSASSPDLLLRSMEVFKLLFLDHDEFDFSLFANHQKPIFEYANPNGDLLIGAFGNQDAFMKVADKPLILKQIGNKVYLLLSQIIDTSSNLQRTIYYITDNAETSQEITFIQDPEQTGGASSWRADQREAPATADDQPVGFWNFLNVDQVPVTPNLYQVGVNSGIHNLFHGGDFGLGAEITIASEASLAFLALPEFATASHTTYYNLGSKFDANTANEHQLVVQDRAKIIVGSGVELTTASKLVLGDAAKIVFPGVTEGDQLVVGKMTVVRPEGEDLTIPSLTNFEIQVPNEQIWLIDKDTLAKEPLPLFVYQGGQLEVADNLVELNSIIENLRLVLEDNTVYLTTSSDYLDQALVAQFRSLTAGGASASLNSLVASTYISSDSFKSASSFSSNEQRLSGRSLGDDFEVPNPPQGKFWVRTQFQVTGFETPTSQGKLGLGVIVAGGYRFSDIYVGQLAGVASTITTEADGGSDKVRARDLGASISNRIAIFNAFGLSVSGGLIFTEYSYKTAEAWVKPENYGHKWNIRTGFDFNYSFGRALAFSHELSWLISRNEVPELNNLAWLDANVRWQNELQLANGVAVGYRLKKINVDHDVKLGLKASFYSNWSKSLEEQKPHWLSFNLTFNTKVEFGLGISLGGFVNFSYSGFKKEQIYLDYLAGIKLEFER